VLHYEVRGTGPAVLLVHGTTGDAASYWGQLRDELAATSRVVTYAQRGFGRSSGSHVRRLDVGLLARVSWIAR
jgi:pimeloyl-ACP methyl ester carboxylesterase